MNKAQLDIAETIKEKELDDPYSFGEPTNLMDQGEEISNSNEKQEESKATEIINEEKSIEKHTNIVFQLEEVKDKKPSNTIPEPTENYDSTKSEGKDVNKNGKALMLLTETIDGKEPMKDVFL